MNKPIPDSVVAGVLALVALIVGGLAWKFVLAPPAPVSIIPRTPEQIQAAFRLNGESVAASRALQLRLYAAAHPGWQPGAAQTQGGYKRVAPQGKLDSGKGK